MDNVKHHDKATTHLSLSPPNPSEPLSPLPSPNSAALAALANARWVPTREQIAVLEGLYSQGMRNPTLKQIHQVAARLQEHGPIEPKNVFYWFESQTFRLGDMNMQQSFDYVSRQFRPPQPLTMLHSSPNHPFSPVQLQASPTPNTPTCNKDAVCMQQPCYPAAQTAENAAYYMQAHGNIHAQASSAVYYQATTQNNTNNQQSRAIPSPRATGSYGVPDASWRRPVTLNLFPQYPTFANREKDCHTVSVAGSARPSTSGSFSCGPRSPEILTGDPSRSFYDFPGEGHEDKH